MKAILLASLFAATLFLGSAQEKRKSKAEVEVLEVKTHRADGKLTVDGRVRNISGHSMKGLIVFFVLEASRNEVVAKKNGSTEPPDLEDGDEAEFHLETSDAVRAVYIRVEAQDKRGFVFRMENNGPFPIE
jgi:hypothetical protein